MTNCKRQNLLNLYDKLHTVNKKNLLLHGHYFIITIQQLQHIHVAFKVILRFCRLLIKVKKYLIC